MRPIEFKIADSMYVRKRTYMGLRYGYNLGRNFEDPSFLAKTCLTPFLEPAAVILRMPK